MSKHDDALVYIGPNCPDFIAQAVRSAMAEEPHALAPGEPDPSHYPDFGDYWDACEAYHQNGKRKRARLAVVPVSGAGEACCRADEYRKASRGE